MPFYHALSALCRSTVRDLTAAEVSAVLPPRGPANAYQNKTRGVVIRTLNQHGFTFQGRKLS